MMILKDGFNTDTLNVGDDIQVRYVRNVGSNLYFFEVIGKVRGITSTGLMVGYITDAKSDIENPGILLQLRRGGISLTYERILFIKKL